MMLQIPKLEGTPFNWLNLRFSIPISGAPTNFDPADDYSAYRAEAFAGGEMCQNLHLEARDLSGGQWVFLDRTHDDTGWDVDLVVAGGASSTTDYASRRNVPLEELQKALTLFESLDVDLSVDASFWISRSRIPVGGNVDKMIGVTLSAGGEELLITGAQWMLRAFQRDYVSWSLYRQPDEDFIGGKIVRRSRESIQPELLVDGYYLATTRFNRFILQKDGIVDAS